MKSEKLRQKQLEPGIGRGLRRPEFGAPSPRCQVGLADARADRFCEEVSREGSVFFLETARGLPVFVPDRMELIPFWSSRRRARIARRSLPEGAAYSLREESCDEFIDITVPWLEEQGIHIGVNWSGGHSVCSLLTARDLLSGMQLWLEAREFPPSFPPGPSCENHPEGRPLDDERDAAPGDSPPPSPV